MTKGEFAKGRTDEQFRRGRRIGIIIMALSVLALIFFLSRPSFRIIARTETLNFAGETIYMLDWTENGKSSLNACFLSSAERDAFESYLGRHGWVEDGTNASVGEIVK